MAEPLVLCILSALPTTLIVGLNCAALVNIENLILQPILAFRYCCLPCSSHLLLFI